jgi:methionyl-tRNA synthetase
MSNFYITTPIYYVNAKPHLGGAYTTLAADVLARWHRMKGEKVFFLTGTDEHGQKIAEEAEKQNITPQKLCDQNAAKYEEVWDTLKISYNKFIRTTNPLHEKLVEKIFKILKEKKLIYQGTYHGLYCVGCERYYTSKELDNGQCPLHQKPVIPISEKCYFFKLSAYQEILIKLIKNNDWLIEPVERKNEVLGFLINEKLEDLAISREKVDWGIKVPGDSSQTIYVWVDALINYLSGVDWSGELGKWPENWPPDVQLIGKDILRFHAIIWPAILLALEAPLPKKLYVHGFFTLGGKKMSKSLGNVLDPEELAQMFGADALRWLMLSLYPFGQDGDISQSKLYDRYNADLSNGLGNLLRRVLTLASKSQSKFKALSEQNLFFKKIVADIWKNYESALEKLKFEQALVSINDLVKVCDQYIEEKEPWRLLKDDSKEYQEVIYNLLESLRHLSLLIQPFMPAKGDQILEQLGLLNQVKKKSLSDNKQWGQVDFAKISLGPVLFPRLEQ